MSSLTKGARQYRISATIDQTLARRLDSAILITGQSRAAFIRDALGEWFSRHGSAEHRIVGRIRKREAAGIGGGA